MEKTEILNKDFAINGWRTVRRRYLVEGSKETKDFYESIEVTLSYGKKGEIKLSQVNQERVGSIWLTVSHKDYKRISDGADIISHRAIINVTPTLVIDKFVNDVHFLTKEG